jgi:hypothetical protein
VAARDRQFDSLENSGFDQQCTRCRGKRVAGLRSARGRRGRDSTLDALRESTGTSIVASSYADILGVPAFFTRSVFEELLSLSDKAGAKSIICEVASALRHCHSPKAV